MKLGLGLSLNTPKQLISNIVEIVSADPDLATALAFKQKIKSYYTGQGDAAAELFNAIPALKSYLNVGHKEANLISATTHPRWNAGAQRIDLITNDNTLSGYEVPGLVYVPSACAANSFVTNCYVKARENGDETAYKIQKDNNDIYTTTVLDCTLELGQANDPSRFIMKRVLQRYSAADSFKGGSSGGIGYESRTESCWGERGGFGNPLAHHDGIQFSTLGDHRVIACGFFSTPAYDDRLLTSEGKTNSGKYTGPYSTGSYGLTDAIRIDSSGAPKKVERVHVLGILSIFGSYYPIGISAQQVDSITRNITIAHSILAPSAFRLDRAAGDSVQVHESLTAFTEGGGLMENIAFYGNEVFGYGPVVFRDRGGPALDITGIWHWNPATLDEYTKSLWINIGLLNANGTPATGMVRSVAGKIETQSQILPTTGAINLTPDLSGVPENATVTMHLVNGMNPLEYNLNGTYTTMNPNTTVLLTKTQALSLRVADGVRAVGKGSEPLSYRWERTTGDLRGRPFDGVNLVLEVV